MIVSGNTIESEVLRGNIKIDPFNKSNVNANSYDVTLHNDLLVYNSEVLEFSKDNATSKLSIPEKGLLLIPGKLYLGRTVEYTETDNYVPILEGRSSVGRLGVCIHATAGFGDIGFHGYWTLELYVIQPIVIKAGIRIAQICFHTIDSCERRYSSNKYQNNTGIQSSMLWKDFE